MDDYKLPIGWECAELKDLGELKTGTTPPKSNKEYYDSKDLEFIKPKDIQNSEITSCSEYISFKAETVARTVDKNSLLVTCIGNIGRLGITTKKVTFNQQINSVTPFQNKILIKFLYYRLLIERNQMEELGSATTVRILNKTRFGKVMLTYPKSLQIQQQIVDKLDKFFEEYEKLKEEKQKAVESYDKILAASISKLIPSNEEELPEGWEERIIKEVCNKIFYGHTDKCTSQKIGPVYLRITDIGDYGKLNTDLKYVKISEKEFERYKLNYGDITIARTGATVGKSYIYNSSKKMVFASYLIKLEPNKQIILPEYLFWFCNSLSYWNFIHENQSGTGQPNVNAQKLAKIRLSIPFPNNPKKSLEVQKQIVKEIQKAKQLQDKINQEKEFIQKQIEDLSKSVLAKAFRGELI